MRNGSILLLTLLLITLSGPLAALELFGIALETANRDELRAAVKAAGLVLVREGGDDHWFDVYDSSTALDGSTRFYLGFVKLNQVFAFAEYEFVGLDRRRLVRDLTLKYGAAEIRRGRFLSDQSHRWQRDGIRIELGGDWHNYKTRLTYFSPQNMSKLQAERSVAAKPQDAAEPSISFY